MYIADRMTQIPFSRIRKVFEEVLRREQNGEDIIHLDVGRPDFDTPQHIKDAARDALERGEVHYTSNYGLPALRRAVARKLAADNGVEYDPEKELIITCGVTEAIFMSMIAHLNPGDEVLVPTPCFPAYHSCIRMAGGVPVDVPLDESDGFIPNVEKLRSAITPRTRMIIINTPCNPTGVVYPRAALENIARMAQEHDLIVVSDEVYEKMIYDGAEHVSIASLPGMKPRTLTLNGFSKSYSMTGWRLGYIAAPEEMTGALLRIRQYVTVCPTSFAQWGAVAALEGPQDDLEMMVAEFARRRRLVCEAIEHMPNFFAVEPHGAFYVLVNISRMEKSPMDLAAHLLDEAKISVVPWGEKHIRISYANSFEKLRTAMERMQSAVNSEQ